MKSLKVEMPPLGMIVAVPYEINDPASFCLHDMARRAMCTIIPVGETPRGAEGPWILSPWGNGPGIVCFLDDWDGKDFLEVKIVEIHSNSVVGVPKKYELA